MKKSKNKKRSLLLILLLLVVGISVGYAALATTLNINGNTTIEKASWDIHFENLVKTTGSETATTEAAIDGTKTLIEYTVTLNEPGDFYEFTVDIVNNGTIDAMISEVLKEGLTTEQEKYISYTATYSDGMALEEKDYLKSGEKENIRVRVKYRDDISAAELPTENQTLSLKFTITYIQADENAKERTVAICRRAAKLHTEECTYTDTTYYCSGAGYTTNGSKGTTTITYGNLGTKGTLASGDAYDCDVNGDGTYDSETERFYYVTELDTNNEYGVLVYYSNVSDGIPNNSVKFAYGTGNDYVGPDPLILHLPNEDNWSSIALTNTNRDIKSHNGIVRVSNFSYAGYSSRLLTSVEVANACRTNVDDNNFVIGELDSCNYIYENTIFSTSSVSSFGYWLESFTYEDNWSSPRVFSIDGCVRGVSANSFSNSGQYGVRPAIEVSKARIEY